MIFDIFNHVSSRGVVCPDSSTLLNIMDSDKVRRTIDSIRDAVKKGNDKQVGELKKMLPAVTWQAHFADGVRNNDHAVPSGLYMLDIDHVDDPEGMFKQWTTALLVDCGVVFVHVSPSGAGLRVVARCISEERKTIAQNQEWLATQLGIDSYDAACKDMARLAFLASYDDILFHDYDALMAAPVVLPAVEGETAAPTQKAATAPAATLFTDEQLKKEYRGHLVGEIAQQWVEHVGVPVEGVRHNFYYELAKTFRHIVDNDFGVLLAQLPDFGLSLDERKKICEHTAKTNRGSKIPYKFYKWMQDVGIEPTPAPSTADEQLTQALAEQLERKKAEALAEVDEEPVPVKVPKLPKVFKEFCAVCPPDFVLPTVNALLPLLGTLATRLRARYLDGTMQTTTFHTVIFAPASSGKSFARRLYNRLTVDLQKHDAFSIAKEQMYLEDLRAKKNATQQPKDPHCPYRIQMAITSVPMILRRQQDAMGLHTITFDEEIDTMAKANKGGSYAQKSDLYRKAWDNAEYGQEYISNNTFTGRVNLYMNFLLLGTPAQMKKFYSDPENGLISRVNFCEIQNQRFAKLPVWKEMSAQQEATIDKVLQRFEQMTYEQVEESDGNEWTVRPTVDIDDKVSFIKPLLEEWLERKRLEAVAGMDDSMDVFRRRSAVKAFRAAMLCVAMYDTLTPAIRKVIADFCLWLADNDLRTLCALYEVEEATQVEKGLHHMDIYSMLGNTFTSDEVYVAVTKRGKKTPVRRITSYWKLDGLVEKIGTKEYRKTQKGGTL